MCDDAGRTSLLASVMFQAYSTIQYTQYKTVQYIRVQYSTHSTVQYMQYSTVQYSTVQYNTRRVAGDLLLIGEGKSCASVCRNGEQ